MSAEAAPTSADKCIEEFVARLNRRVPDGTKYQQFIPLLSALIEQATAGRPDSSATERIINALPPGALVAGAEPLAYLRRHWGAGLRGAAPRSAAASASAAAASRTAVPHAASPSVARGAAIVRGASVTPASASPSSPSPASPSPSSPSPSSPSPASPASPASRAPSAAAPAPSPSSSAAAVAISVAPPDRALIRDAAEAAGGTVKFSWAQSSLFDSLGIPRDTFGGFCALTVGEFLIRPDTIEAKLRSSRGKIDLLNANGRYRGSGKPSYEFITGEFGLTYVGVTEVATLTPEHTLAALESLRGTRHMIGVLRTGGGSGHAGGVIVSGGKYSFFDAEEGQAELPNRDAFWRFLYRYITHATKGLARDYQRVFVATWS